MGWVLVLLSPCLFLAWLLAHPQLALALIAELKRRLRLRLIRREGERAARLFAHQLRIWGRKRALDPRLVEEVIAAHKEAVAEGVGRKRADAILGEPTSLERYH